MVVIHVLEVGFGFGMGISKIGVATGAGAFEGDWVDFFESRTNITKRFFFIEGYYIKNLHYHSSHGDDD